MARPPEPSIDGFHYVIEVRRGKDYRSSVVDDGGEVQRQARAIFEAVSALRADRSSGRKTTLPSPVIG
jgi:hypothetical protein